MQPRIKPGVTFPTPQPSCLTASVDQRPTSERAITSFMISEVPP